jgi:hypothetical protein
MAGNVKRLFERETKKYLAGKNNWREKKKIWGKKNKLTHTLTSKY